MWCDNCGSELASEDAFCGMCGAPSRTPGNGAEANPVVVVNSGVVSSGVPVSDDTAAPSAGFGAAQNHVSGGRFFSHAQQRPAGDMTNATRYLSAAAYLDPAYCGDVISELVSSHRAVAPSIGVDLGVIVRHCLRSRAMRMGRDIVLSILLLIGLIVAFGPTLFFLLLSFFVGFLPSVNWARKTLPVKVFAIVGSIFLFLNFLTFIFFVFLASAVGTIEGGLTGSLYGGAQPSSGIAIAGITTLLIGVGVGLAIIVTQVIFTYARNRTLCEELAPGARPRTFRPQGSEVETRLAQIERAQHGNLVLYAGDRPFIGTGIRQRSWSIAIELERMTADGPAPPNASCAREYAPIDPVELHQVIRERLLGLRDSQLPPNEQIRALTVHDHIVGPGWLRRGTPLIDKSLSVPYSQASDVAVDALIRHPQAGMRYYQRVSIRDEGQAVWSGPDKVIDGTDLEIASSAFIYAAVEGRMFYLEFVSTVLPPVHSRLHLIDLLPRFSAGRFLTYVLIDSLSSIFRDLIYAPARAVRSIRQAAREGRSYRRHADVVKDMAYDNVGAFISVRERGSANHLGTYIQELDAEKYTKLVERLVTDTVMDFLDSRGVNISEFVNSANTVINNNGVISDSNFVSNSRLSGNFNVGNRGTVRQNAGQSRGR